MTGQNDRQARSLTGQVHDQAGHCPLTGRYLQPCMLSMLYVRLTIKVKVGIPESVKVGWHPHKTGSSHLKTLNEVELLACKQHKQTA